MKQIVFDIETDGVKATKIHCLSYCIIGEYKLFTLYNKEDIINFFNTDAIFIGHFISGFDLPVLSKLLSIDFSNKIFYDTLFLSSYIFPNRNKYGLEDFGETFGIKKVVISKEGWFGDISDEGFKELITRRCEEDVKINTNLWVNIIKRLNKLYDSDEAIVKKFLDYIAFKAKCAYDQQINPLLIDRDGAVDLLAKLNIIKLEKEEALIKVMPKNPIYSVKNKPKNMYLKDGSYNSFATKWFDFLNNYNLPLTTEKPIKYITKLEEPNPRSSEQIKNWLYSLGWEPCTFRFERNKETNETKEIPQILNGDKELTESVRLLLNKVPELELLEGLGVIRHRISLLEGRETKYDDDRRGLLYSIDTNNYIPQTLRTITSTLRFKHANVVNIPSLVKPYGKELRKLFIAPKGKVVIGCDVKNLESKTRDHCIQKLDPDYVEEMSQPGYDNHLDIAVFAGLLTPQQAEAHKSGEADFSKERKIAKQLNFAAVYNVGAKTLSRSTGLTISKCEQLLDGYWKRNWAVKEFSNRLITKSCLGSKWIKSEVSGFWLELRSDNDKFSAHNQNLGVYFFDTWLAYVKHYGVNINLQSHDEILFYWDEDKVEDAFKILHKAAKLANQKLSLNVNIGVDVQSGNNYAEVH